MKISFIKLPDTDGTIQVSFDGGVTFSDYSIPVIRENGIPLNDDQDYSKIQIKGSASILTNLEVVKNINFENKLMFTLTSEASFGSGDYGYHLSKEEADILNEILNGRALLFVTPTDNYWVNFNYDNQGWSSWDWENGVYGLGYTHLTDEILNNSKIYIADNYDNSNQVELPITFKFTGARATEE